MSIVCLEKDRLCLNYTRTVVTSRILSLVKLEFMNATTIPECQTLDVKKSATELGVCEETVRRLVRRKVLRKLPGLRCILIPKNEIHRFLNER